MTSSCPIIITSLVHYDSPLPFIFQNLSRFTWWCLQEGVGTWHTDSCQLENHHPRHHEAADATTCHLTDQQKWIRVWIVFKIISDRLPPPPFILSFSIGKKRYDIWVKIGNKVSWWVNVLFSDAWKIISIIILFTCTSTQFENPQTTRFPLMVFQTPTSD